MKVHFLLIDRSVIIYSKRQQARNGQGTESITN